MKDNLQQTVPLPRATPEHSGNGQDPAAPAGTVGNRRRGLPKTVVLPFLLIVLIAGAIVGYQFWMDQSLYVSTDNAQVAGNLVQVGAVNAGRIESVGFDIGDQVQRDQVVGTVLLPSTLSMTQSGTPLLGFVGTENQRTEIKSPISGVVVARQANPGDTIAAGQSVVTLIDPSKLWIQAQIEETKIGRVQVGQPVEVKVDSLGKTLNGKVTAVNRASSATFSLLPSSNASGNYTRVTQLVPVKISADYGSLPLVLGSSVEVRIKVQD